MVVKRGFLIKTEKKMIIKKEEAFVPTTYTLTAETQEELSKLQALICGLKGLILTSDNGVQIEGYAKNLDGLSIPPPRRGSSTGTQGIPASRTTTIRRLPTMCELSGDPSFNPLIF